VVDAGGARKASAVVCDEQLELLLPVHHIPITRRLAERCRTIHHIRHNFPQKTAQNRLFFWPVPRFFRVRQMASGKPLYAPGFL
jgi:hypothetical protein